MISKKDICFECDIQENISVEDIRKEYEEGVIIWVNGSGSNPKGKPASYRCVLDYMGHTKYMEKEIPDVTAHYAMITGIIDAVKCINKSVRLNVVCTTSLGFAGGFDGIGVNSALFQKLYELIKEKKCTLTEVQCVGCGEKIKKFIYSCNPDKSGRNEYDAKVLEKEKKKYQYRAFLYSECISKVTKILTMRGVDSKIINEIKKIKPEEKHYEADC